MVKRVSLCVLLVMISIVLSVAQSSPYYWYNGKKNYLEVVQQKRYVVVKDVDTLVAVLPDLQSGRLEYEDLQSLALCHSNNLRLAALAIRRIIAYVPHNFT